MLKKKFIFLYNINSTNVDYMFVSLKLKVLIAPTV